MKKTLSLTLALTLAFSLCSGLSACGDNNNGTSNSTIQGASQQEQQQSVLAFESNGDGTCSVVGFESRNKFDKVINIPETSPDGESVTKIGENAFLGMDNFSQFEIIIPATVSEIGANAFYRCYQLVKITVAENNQQYMSIDGNLYTKDGKNLIQYAIGKADKTFSIPENVTTIKQNAFYDCKALTTLILDKDLQIIEENAFQYCKIMSVTLGENVEEIQSGAFVGCQRLVEIIDNSKIGITKGSPYNGQIAVNAIEVHTGTSKIEYIDDFYFYRLGNVNYVIGSKSNPHTLVLPKDFKGESYVVYQNAFTQNSFLESVVFSEGVTEIQEKAFLGQSWLESVVLSKSVTVIAKNAFESCQNLENVYYCGTATDWAKIKIEDNFYLTRATRYYYSANQPQEEGNFWHYDENGSIVIWE